MGINFYWLVIGILVVWRITHLLYGEDGPWNILVKLRRAAGDEIFGSLMDCFYCMSVWVAMPMAYFLGADWRHRWMLWPALSAGAILLERLTSKEQLTAKVFYTEDEESDHVLRQKPSSTEKSNIRPFKR